MKTQKSTHLLLLQWIVALILGWGCQSDSTNTPMSSEAELAPPLYRASVNAGCTTSSGELTSTSSLVLYSSTSQAVYGPGLVAAPTLVSLSICNLDTVGNRMRPKAQVFGPASVTSFAGSVIVHVSYPDAGLTAGDPGNTLYMLYRQNDVTGEWLYYGMPQLRPTYIRYKIRHNGSYALGLSNNVWTASRNVTSTTEAIIYVLNSYLAVPDSAVTDPIVVQFTIADVAPEGLPNAFSKLYEYGPDSTYFNVAVLSSVSFDDAEIGSIDPFLVRFFYFDETSNTWIEQTRTVDTTNRRFVVRLDHFSRYAFAR